MRGNEEWQIESVIKNWVLTLLFLAVEKCCISLRVQYIIEQNAVRELGNKSLSFIKKTRFFKYIENFATKKQKNENFQIKKSDIFHFSAQNIDCDYSLEPSWQGDSNEYPQSMFWAKISKTNVYPYKPQFYYIKVGFKGVKNI